MSTFEDVKHELEAWSNLQGVSPSLLLQLSEPLRSTLKRVLRQGSMTSEELAQSLGLTADETDIIADLLVACGFLKTSEAGPSGQPIYRIRHSKPHRPEAPAAVWELLLDTEEGDDADDDGGPKRS